MVTVLSDAFCKFSLSVSQRLKALTSIIAIEESKKKKNDSSFVIQKEET